MMTTPKTKTRSRRLPHVGRLSLSSEAAAALATLVLATPGGILARQAEVAAKNAAMAKGGSK